MLSMTHRNKVIIIIKLHSCCANIEKNAIGNIILTVKNLHKIFFKHILFTIICIFINLSSRKRKGLVKSN
jgi:hypothetical protein